MKIFNLSLVLWGFILLSGCSSADKNTITVEFNQEMAEDASHAVLSVMNEVSENGITELVFEKGTYHFYPDKAFGLFRSISNHDNGPIRTPFPIIDMKNLTIDGQGSMFIFHGVMIPFLLQDSEGITVKNFSIDWGTPFHSEGKVVANNLTEHTYDLKIGEEYPYVIRNEQLIFLKEYYEHSMGQSYLFDPETKSVVFNNQRYSTWYTVLQSVSEKHGRFPDYKYSFSDDEKDPNYRDVKREIMSRFEQVSPGRVRVYNHPKDLPPVGAVMVMKGDKGVNRIAPAFHVVETTDFLAWNVNVFHAGGMGLIAENSTNITLDNFNVTPSEGRMVSATADATHFVGCRGEIVLKNCTLTNQLDDGTNVHGAYQEVVDVLGEKTLGVRIGHFQQQGYKLGLPGDKIGIVRREGSIYPYQSLTLLSIEENNGRYMIMTFKETLPDDIKSGDLLENLTAYPSLLVKNCNISKNRARGLLISTPRKTIIENNYFHTDMMAILSPADRSLWYESGFASNLTIRNNVFQDCSFGGGNRGVIEFSTDPNVDETVFRNITISNNTFNAFDNLILSVEDSENFTFENNKITKTNQFSTLFPESPAFKLISSQGVQFHGNSYDGTADPIFESDASLSSLEFE